MPLTSIGLVYYADDVTKSPFRIVYPTVDDSELNEPQWLTLGLDPARVAVMEVVPSGSGPPYMLVTPFTAAADAIQIVATDAAIKAALAATPANANAAATAAATASPGATAIVVSNAVNAAMAAVTAAATV